MKANSQSIGSGLAYAVRNYITPDFSMKLIIHNDIWLFVPLLIFFPCCTTVSEYWKAAISTQSITSVSIRLLLKYPFLVNAECMLSLSVGDVFIVVHCWTLSLIPSEELSRAYQYFYEKIWEICQYFCKRIWWILMAKHGNK